LRATTAIAAGSPRRWANHIWKAVPRPVPNNTVLLRTCSHGGVAIEVHCDRLDAQQLAPDEATGTGQRDRA
jgi:hypothetical protein